MYGRDTFIVRVDDEALAPQIRKGDYVYVDPDEPAVPGRFVAVWDAVQAETTVRMLARSGGRDVLRVFDGSRSDEVLDASNETDIQGAVVFVGRRVR
ncbi:MAG: hypothetical protein OXP09_16715 [Gammaproteobacteria bacterium]|nr:hypothetical protein [Gammaproteobacteria bacterium]MDE0367201.1 hypothetical protein [Gammaproteobacteria bacterium]